MKAYISLTKKSTVDFLDWAAPCQAVLRTPTAPAAFSTEMRKEQPDQVKKALIRMTNATLLLPPTYFKY